MRLAHWTVFNGSGKESGPPGISFSTIGGKKSLVFDGGRLVFDRGGKKRVVFDGARRYGGFRLGSQKEGGFRLR
jgi:hypothetical protein